MSRGIAWLLAAGTVATLGVACFSEHQPAEPDATVDCARAELPPGPDTAFVIIRGFAFTPGQLRVPTGTRVVWINCESPGTPGHTSTADGTWDSPTLQPGQVYGFTPTTGIWGYHCRPHPFMTGTVIVE